MHRIDGDGHVANLFTEGDPGIGQQATVVTDDWCNEVQEELCKTIEAAGITLAKASPPGNVSQLLTALKTIGLFGGVSGGGIGQLKFPSTQNPSSDANTLDDYEEGVWTPVIGGAGGTSGQTYVTQAGLYVKIGQLVVLYGSIELSAKGTITGNVVISGLPFTSLTLANLFSVGGVSFRDLATSWGSIFAATQSNSAVALVRGIQSPAITNDTALTTTDIANNSKFSFTLAYRAAA